MLACATSSASTSAARTSSWAPCPRTGAASSPCTRPTTHAEQGADAVVDRIAKMVDAVITQVSASREGDEGRFSRCRRWRAGPARSRARHGRGGAESRMARLPAARLDLRSRRPPGRAGQRRELRHDRRVVEGRRAGREERRRDHDRHRHRRRHHHEWRALSRRVGRGGRDRTHHHRLHRALLPLRQLRMPRGVRVRARDRAARARGARARRGLDAPPHGGRPISTSSTPPRSTPPRTPATRSRSRWCATPRSSSAPASAICSTS